MEQTKEINAKIKLYTDKLRNYEEYQDLIGNESFTRLKNLIKEFKVNSELAMNENRLMRIGIIGQIKRGKSSFLNALFFEGEDVLPKAATPMTAALTKINFSEKPKAVVDFYTQNEWEEIKNKAEEAKEIIKINAQNKNESKITNLFNKSTDNFIPKEASTDQKSCLELVNMVIKNDIDVDDYLGTNKEITESASTKELINELGNFVGSQGKFTPIVKSTTLSLNIETLKGIEIVDTPGMNDPIVSRAMKTEEYIGQCDVVFLLSYCSQFLDITDMRLLAQNIPSKGVRNIILVGSLFDSVLLDVFEDYDSIGEALASITEKKHNEARTNFLNVKNEISKKSLSDALDSAFPPVFISSMCYNISKHYNNLNDEEQNVLENLNLMYDDFDFDTDTLNSLANFEEIQGKFVEVKQDKDNILAKKFTNTLEGFSEGFSYEIQLIKKRISLSRDKLAEGDLDNLALKHSRITKQLNSSKIKINSVFEKHAIEAEKSFSDLILEIDEAANFAKKINSKTGSETHSYQVSNAKWYNPFSWGSKRTEYNTIQYTYANIHDAVEQLEEYVFSSKQVLIRAIKEIINIKQFRSDVIETITNLFDFNDDNFDLDDIIIPVENAVNRITIPSVNINAEKHIDTVRGQFKSSKVKDDKIITLRKEQARVVGIITKDIKLEISKMLIEIKNKLETVKKEFIPSLAKDFDIELSNLEEQIKNREDFLKRYDEVLQIL